MSDSLRPHGLHSPWNSPGENTGVGSLSLLQRNFPTQESNPGLLHCRWILYQLSCLGSLIKIAQSCPLSRVWFFVTPWMIESVEFSRSGYCEWVAFPFFRGSSKPRDWTQVSHTVVRFFTIWAIREGRIVPNLKALTWGVGRSGNALQEKVLADAKAALAT